MEFFTTELVTCVRSTYEISISNFWILQDWFGLFKQRTFSNVYNTQIATDATVATSDKYRCNNS